LGKQNESQNKKRRRALARRWLTASLAFSPHLPDVLAAESDCGMGWLRPEPQLVQAPGWQTDGAAHTRTDEARAELPVPALGARVPCVRITGGGDASAAEETLDAGFEFCPQLSRHGFPLMLKRELTPADTGERVEGGFGGWKVTPAQLAAKVFLYRLMSAPGEGLSPIWELGGCAGARPPAVLAARADGLPFTPADWSELREFYAAFAPTAWQLQRIEAVTSERACMTETDFDAALKEWCAPRAWTPPAPSLAQRYPVGARVEARGLSREALNGKVGVVAAQDEERGRVGVLFREGEAPLALRPRNLLRLGV
jgi:hypothetical protein